jgi:tRNA A37 threonylcarbamoyladenosine modification protein TsaB
MAQLPDFSTTRNLVIDASSHPIFVGLIENGEWKWSQTSEEPALECLFMIVEDCMKSSNCELSDIDQFIYDRGPGSILGIRSVISALNAWQILSDHSPNIVSFQSLDLVAHSLAKSNQNRFAILSDWKKGYWNIWHTESSVEKGIIDTIDVEGIKELTESIDQFYYLPQKKVWANLPIEVETVSLNPLDLIEHIQKTNLLNIESTATAYMPEVPNYAKWDTKRHGSD